MVTQQMAANAKPKRHLIDTEINADMRVYLRYRTVCGYALTDAGYQQACADRSSRANRQSRRPRD